jgi:hypothetical protein
VNGIFYFFLKSMGYKDNAILYWVGIMLLMIENAAFLWTVG